jgi:uncharacterized protein YlxW (UPF0749 family)
MWLIARATPATPTLLACRLASAQAQAVVLNDQNALRLARSARLSPSVYSLQSTDYVLQTRVDHAATTANALMLKNQESETRNRVRQLLLHSRPSTLSLESLLLLLAAGRIHSLYRTSRIELKGNSVSTSTLCFS